MKVVFFCEDELLLSLSFDCVCVRECWIMGERERVDEGGNTTIVHLSGRNW